MLFSVGSIISSCFIFDIYIFGITILLTLGFWIIGKFKTESKILYEKIEEASLKYSANFERTKRIFSKLYSDTLNQTNIFSRFIIYCIY